MNKFERPFNDELLTDTFIDAVLSNLCEVVARLARIDGIPSNREAQIAFIYLRSDLSISHLIDCLNKEDVIADASWLLDERFIAFDSQNLEDGYNRAIAEVKSMFLPK